MSMRDKDKFGGGAEAQARLKQYDYAAVSYLCLLSIRAAMLISIQEV
jgi:hypothetical protein